MNLTEEELREKRLLRSKAYYQKNKDKLKEKNNAWRKANSDKVKEFMKVWSSENKDKIKERRQEYYIKNKKEIMDKKKEYAKINSVKIKKYMKEYWVKRGRKYTEKERLQSQARRYGMTDNDYVVLLNSQDGGCAICSSPPSVEKSGRLHIDHDHVTGNVRGLLCGKCNRGIGLLKDDVDILSKAIGYIEISRKKEKCA